MTKIFNFIFQKKIITTAIVVFLALLLHKAVENFLSNLLVKNILSEIDSNGFNDFIFLVIVLLIILGTILKFKKYIPSVSLLFYLLFATCFYLYYRISSSVWIFTPFSFFNFLKYSDVIIVLMAANFFLLIRGKKENSYNEKEAFFGDESLGEHKKDEFGYDNYCQLIAYKIRASYFNNSFAIGINGKWGSGKTSFIDLLKRHLIDDEIISIDFKPWNSNSKKAIIEDFFESFQEALEPYYAGLSRLLVSYSNKLEKLDSNSITQTFKTTVSIATGSESLNSLFNEINTSLKKIDKKIIIYIDDIDRSENEEIREVIRIIRNTGNFYNTFFIVAYDRNYIISALKQQNDYNDEMFLEKIFQIEITLPYFDNTILRQNLAAKLFKVFDEKHHNEISSDIFGTSYNLPVDFKNWLLSIRDVTRLTNALSLNLKMLIGEVDFSDFIKLELLHLKFPAVYELLFTRTDYFFELSKTSTQENYYRLKTLKSLNDNAKKNQTTLEVFLMANYLELSVPKSEIENIVEYINDLFNDGISLFHYKRTHLSVVFPGKFRRYFAYELLKGNLSEIEFTKAMSELNQSTLNEKLNTWIKDGLEDELIFRFSKVKSFESKEDFEKVIKAIFFLATQPSITSPNAPIIGYFERDLIDKLRDNKIKSFYTQDGLKRFILELFDQANSPFEFESKVLRSINHLHFGDFPLSKNEIKSLSVNFLKRYVNESYNLNSKTFALFWNCMQTDWVPAGGGVSHNQEQIAAEAAEIMKQFVLNKDLDGCLFAIIRVEPFDQQKFAIEQDFVLATFENWDNFKASIFAQNEEVWKYLKEFKQFFDVFEASGLNKWVNFDFKEIPITEKITKR